MEEYPIYAFRTRVGTVTRQPVGLYDNWTAQLPGQSGCCGSTWWARRRALCWGHRPRAGDGLCCCRKLARSSQPRGIVCAAWLPPGMGRLAAGWRAFVAHRGGLRGGGDAWRRGKRAGGGFSPPTAGGDRRARLVGAAVVPGGVLRRGQPVDCAVPLPAAPPELPEDPEIAEMSEMPGE